MGTIILHCIVKFYIIIQLFVCFYEKMRNDTKKKKIVSSISKKKKKKNVLHLSFCAEMYLVIFGFSVNAAMSKLLSCVLSLCMFQP